jgi:hypothetical protein
VPGLTNIKTHFELKGRRLQHVLSLNSRHGRPPRYLLVDRDDACLRRPGYPSNARQRNLPIDSISIRPWMVSSVPSLLSYRQRKAAPLSLHGPAPAAVARLQPTRKRPCRRRTPREIGSIRYRTDTISSSTCTECCIFQFGLGNCGASVLWDGIVRDPGCNSIWAREQALGFPGIQGVSCLFCSPLSPLLCVPSDAPLEPGALDFMSLTVHRA